jgi:hypothetical protein
VNCRHDAIVCRSDTLGNQTYFGMGFLEGYLTSQMMCDFTYNYELSTFNGNETQRDLVVDFLTKNYDWATAQVATNVTSVYWRQVCLHVWMNAHSAE